MRWDQWYRAGVPNLSGSPKTIASASNLARASERPCRRIMLALVSFWVLLPGTAAADLLEDRDRVVAAYGRSGGTVLLTGSRYMFNDESAQFALPSTVAECVRVAVLGGRGMSLRARFSDATLDEPEARSSSHAGALQLTRCGAPASRVLVVNESGSGAVEVVAIAASAALPSLGSVLPERGQSEARAPEMPLPMNLASPERRAASARDAALREGASEVSEERSVAPHGPGQLELTLEPGCHRVVVVATSLGAADPSRVDVDAELRDTEGILLGRDKTDAPDARLEPCTTTKKSVMLSFVGAPEGSTVLVETARFPVAKEVSHAFGNDARLRMDRALRKRGARIEGAPLLLAQGGSGVARVPFETDRIGCYLAVAAVSEGTPHGLGLRAHVGSFDSEDERGSSDDSGVVAFCARGEKRVSIDVEARSVGVRWGLSLYRMSATTVGVRR
jgi:hypothetical protein